MNKNEENVWDDVRKAKNQSDFRSKPYDAFSPTLDFEGKSAVVKKAEYINKPAQNIENLMEIGGSQPSKKFEDVFEMGGQQKSGGFFDFDFNAGQSQQAAKFEFEFGG